jgi:N-sulfoglucosamine sulfohydrolase
MASNILLITADDMGGDTPGFCGGPAQVTPTLDRLAEEGMTFTRAHVPAAVCQPSRSAIMTGRWPHRNGAEGFQPINDDVPVITRLLGDAGYLVGILGKVEHLQPEKAFGWDVVRGFRDLGMGRNPGAYGEAAARFLERAVAEGRPWFLMANSHDPHRPFSGSEEEQNQFPPEARAGYPAPSRVFGPADTVDIPGFLPPLPDVAREYREYLSSSRRCDDVVAAVLGALRESGAAEETLVVFLSDNGIALPFAKANCYLQSTLTPFVVRWPGVTTPGSRQSEAFVSMLDLFPSFCDAAGLPQPDGLDGRTLLSLLQGQSDDDRNAVVTVFQETAAKKRYEMRAWQTGEVGYIWNQWADGTRDYVAENMWGRSWAAMLAAASEDEWLARRTAFYLRRAPEELYDLGRDPDSLTNLATDPASRERLDLARRNLLEWMVGTGDPLLPAYRQFLGRSPARSGLAAERR